MKKAIVALMILAVAASPALAKKHGKPRHSRKSNAALCFPYGDTAVAAATAFSIIFDSIKGVDRYYPVPVAQPVYVPQPVPVPVCPPQPVYYQAYQPVACNLPAAYAPVPYYPVR
ncbi:MAG: hypothetical protein IT574_04990 [Candidatus Aureabacteria bacterium]|nr:hypothetical protein [Candidatus Auribacterota bacterium]HOE27731.1 hypothetical protein [bacterium]HQM51737.1 hypothetical protein [bacterium]